VTIVRVRSLFAAAMLAGIYSFLGAGWMLLLDAPDVAFTEASVGAGISTVLMLSTLSLTRREEKGRHPWLPLHLAAVLLTGAALVYGTFDMPHVGSASAPVQTHVSPEYLADAVPRTDGTVLEVGIPNIVTTVLASYRGYDTLGETMVIFTATIAVLLLLGGRRRRRRDPAGRERPEDGSER